MIWLALLVTSGTTAWAASRLTLTSAEVVVVELGGEQMLAGMGGTQHIAPHLLGGLYPIEVRAQNGDLLYAGQVNLPPAGDIRATWSRTAGLLVSGADASATAAASVPAGTAPGTVRAVGTPDKPYLQPEKPAKAIDDSGAGSRDRSGASSDETAGWSPPSEVTETVTRAAGATTIGSLGTSAVSGAASGVSSVLRNAESGTSFGTTPTGYQPQGNPYAAPAVTGTVVLENPRGLPVEVFVDGMFLARFGQDQKGPLAQKVGEGLVRIEWYDPGTRQKIAGGTLKVEKDKRVGLALNGASGEGISSVEVKDRPWAYAAEP
jgi:hypothetical protein